MSLRILLDEIKDPNNIVGLVNAFLVSYVVMTTVYNLYLHPLAKYPGPFWCKLSSIPSWYYTKNQDRHLWLLSLQEKYGTTFRYAPNSIAINTPTGFHEIFGAQGNVAKGDYYKMWRKTIDFVNAWNATSIPDHARRRRVMNHAFSEAALKGSEPFLHSNIDRWLEILGDNAETGSWTKSTNMADQVTYLVFDILGDLAFGKRFGMMEPDSELRHIPELMMGYLQLMNPICWSPFKDLWLWLKPRGLDALVAKAAPDTIKSWDAFVKDCLESRLAKQKALEEKPGSETRKDIFHWCYETQDPETGKRYTLSELFAECELMVIAGSDTTANVISAMFFYLARNPDVQAKLAKEISSAFSSYEDIKAGPALVSCKYLTALIQEAIRMAPPVSAEPPREVRQGGTTIDGQYFPAGTKLSTAFWAMHYNPGLYPEPYQFRPERWIVGEGASTKESVALAQRAFCGFSAGTRNCVGKNLAWLEMRIVMAKAIWKFEIKQDENNKLGGGSAEKGPWRSVEDQYQTYEVFVSDRKGPVVQFKKRDH